MTKPGSAFFFFPPSNKPQRTFQRQPATTFGTSSLETPYPYAYFSPSITTSLRAASQKEREKERKKGKEVIPPRFAAVIPPSEVDVDGVGMNRWRVVIHLVSKPTASSPSFPGVAGRGGWPPSPSRLSTAVARRRRWPAVAPASCISPGR